MCNCQSPCSSTYYPTVYPYGTCAPVLCADSSLSPCSSQIDCQCIIYHKFNSNSSTLTNLGITNGATLELILSTIDPYIGQLKVTNFDISYLRTLYVINSMQQFCESVSTELSSVHDSIEAGITSDSTSHWLGNLSSDPGGAVDGDMWYNTTSNLLKIKVNSGVVKTITTS